MKKKKYVLLVQMDDMVKQSLDKLTKQHNAPKNVVIRMLILKEVAKCP